MLKKLADCGVNLDAKLPTTGESALQIACDMNYLEAIRCLIAQRCNIISHDGLNVVFLRLKKAVAYIHFCLIDKGMTALMKASCVSLQATRMLLGLPEESHILLKKLEKEVKEMVFVRDYEGKDCYVHAALSGRDDVLEMFQQIVAGSGSAADVSGELLGEGGQTERASRRNIEWTAADFTKVVKIIQMDNIRCLTWLLDEGFQVSMQDAITGRGLATYACEFGNMDALDLLMNRDINLSLPDFKFSNIFHFAASCAQNQLTDFIIHHRNALRCKVNPQLMTSVDRSGETPLHVAGRCGALVAHDLLSADQWAKCLAIESALGCTPLMEACKHQHAAVTRLFIEKGADATVIDAQGHNLLWHYLRPVEESLERNGSKEYGESALLLYRCGCRLYSDDNGFENMTKSIFESNDAGDFVVLCMDTESMKKLRDTLLEQSDALWKLGTLY